MYDSVYFNQGLGFRDLGFRGLGLRGNGFGFRGTQFMIGTLGNYVYNPGRPFNNPSDAP